MAKAEADQSRQGILRRQEELEKKLTADYLSNKITLDEYVNMLDAVGVPPLDFIKLSQQLGQVIRQNEQ